MIGERNRSRYLRVAEECPLCLSPLVIDGEELVCIAKQMGGCNFSELQDKRSGRLMERILDLEGRLSELDPTAPLFPKDAA